MQASISHIIPINPPLKKKVASHKKKKIRWADEKDLPDDEILLRIRYDY